MVRLVKLLLCSLALVLAGFFISKADAAGPGHGFVDGNALYDSCNEGTEVSDLFCMTYVMGATDAAVNLDRVMSPGGPHFCLPSNVVPKQLVDIVKNYLRDNPADRADVAGEMVDVALMRAFPCK